MFRFQKNTCSFWIWLKKKKEITKGARAIPVIFWAREQYRSCFLQFWSIVPCNPQWRCYSQSACLAVQYICKCVYCCTLHINESRILLCTSTLWSVVKTKESCSYVWSAVHDAVVSSCFGFLQLRVQLRHFWCFCWVVCSLHMTEGLAERHIQEIAVVSW